MGGGKGKGKGECVSFRYHESDEVDETQLRNGGDGGNLYVLLVDETVVLAALSTVGCVGVSVG